MANAEPELVMIYNADGGLLNGVRDSFWKTFRPSTYPCALCALAFGFFTIKSEWRAFLDRQPYAVADLHSDDYHERFPALEEQLPVILLARPGQSPREVVSAQEMEAMDSLDQLISLAEKRLAELSPR